MSEPKVINYETALAALQNAVNEKGGDYKYKIPVPPFQGPACRYAIDGEPSCIVGNVLIKGLGLPASHFEFIRDENDFGDDGEFIPRKGKGGSAGAFGAGAFDFIVDAVEDAYDIKFTEKAKKLLLKAQSYQDGAYTWQEAMEAGIEAASHISE